MNYRHAYHAGNFADVLKHGVLCWVIRYLQQKEAPLAFVDTHAGRGVYDLTAPEAAKTGEAQNGILRLVARNDAPATLEPYLDLVRAFSSAGASPSGGEAGTRGTHVTDEGPLRTAVYPGSAALMTALARPDDRVVANELHPDEAQELKRLLLPGTAGVPPALSASRAGKMPAVPGRLQILSGDGYATLLKHIPPREKRGLVLIDPPFEAEDEFERLAATFIAAHRKWPTGVYMLWFPIKHEGDTARFTAELTNAGIRKLTLITLDVARAEGMSATGLLLCNAPFTLAAEWRAPLTWLAETLAQGPAPSGVIEELAP